MRKSNRDYHKTINAAIQSLIALLTSSGAYASCISLSTNSTVVGIVNDCITWTGGNLTLTSAGTISTSGDVAISASGSVGTLLNNGLVASTSTHAVVNTGTISIVNNSTVSGGDAGILNNGQILSLVNAGTGSITGTFNGIQNTSTIVSLNNSGVINGSSIISSGISNNGQIDTLTNSGTISSGNYGIKNQGSIGNIVNDGSVTGIYNSGTIGTIGNDGHVSGNYHGIYNAGGTISTLSNTGSISGTNDGIVNLGNIGTLYNTGTISNTTNAVHNDTGSIGTLINSGTMSGTTSGVFNYHTNIGAINNSGRISGDQYALYNSAATISSLTNTGTISSSGFAIYNDAGGVMGPIVNSGIILGDIYSASSLTIAGGANSTIGKLTGYASDGSTSSIGSISISSGDLTFNSGNLLLNDHVTISSGALNNTGSALYLANSITVNGDYNQSAAASLHSYVTGANTYGQLVVNGTATIALGSSIHLISQNYAFANGQRYVVIKATAGNYNAPGLTYEAAGYSGTVTGSTETEGGYTNLVLTLGQNSGSGGNPSTPAAQATTYNALSALNGLQRYAGTSNAALLNLYNASLAIGSTAEGNRVGEQLSPHQNASASYATSAATFDMLSVIGRHLGSGSAIAQSGGSSGISAGEAGPSDAVWGQAFGGHASQGMSHDVSGYRANYSGAVFGYDRAVNNDWRAGGALSYSYTNVNGTDNVQGSNSNVASIGLTAYASYVAPTWYSNLYATIAGQRYNTQRVIGFTGYNGTANGKFNGQQYVLNAEFGYPLALQNDWTLTPVANLSYSHQRQSGYTESGGNGAALQVNAARSEAIKSGLGARLDTKLQTRWGDVVPYAQLVWNHQYNDSRMAISAAYAADASNTGFTSLGSSPAKNTANLTLGATLLRANDTSLTAYYALSKASHYTNQAVSLRFRQAF